MLALRISDDPELGFVTAMSTERDDVASFEKVRGRQFSAAERPTVTS